MKIWSNMLFVTEHRSQSLFGFQTMKFEDLEHINPLRTVRF